MPIKFDDILGEDDARDAAHPELEYYSPAMSSFDRPITPIVRRVRWMRKVVLVVTIGAWVSAVGIWFWRHQF